MSEITTTKMDRKAEAGADHAQCVVRGAKRMQNGGSNNNGKLLETRHGLGDGAGAARQGT